MQNKYVQSVFGLPGTDEIDPLSVKCPAWIPVFLLADYRLRWTGAAYLVS
jgi:hypothetical protein